MKDQLAELLLERLDGLVLEKDVKELLHDGIELVLVIGVFIFLRGGPANFGIGVL